MMRYKSQIRSATKYPRNSKYIRAGYTGSDYNVLDEFFDDVFMDATNILDVEYEGGPDGVFFFVGDDQPFVDEDTLYEGLVRCINSSGIKQKLVREYAAWLSDLI